MAFKFALIVAVACIAQGLAFQPMGRPFRAQPPCKVSDEEITHDFEEAVHDMDEVREEVSAAVVDAYFKGNDPEVIIACFRAQRENYVKLGQHIHELMRKASQEMAQELGDLAKKYAQKAAEPLRKIGTTMKELPEKMYAYIKDKEFGKAFEVMKESRRIVEENSRILQKIINEMREEVPEAAKKAQEMANQIRAEARKGCRVIGEAFRKCVQEGGPKTPVEDDQEVAVEQQPQEE